MIFKVFLILFLPLFLVFSSIAFSFKSIKTYFVGFLTSSIYFIGALEAIVYIYCNKIPLNQVPVLGFLVNVVVQNPYQGPYKFLAVNYKYNFLYFWLIAVIFIIGLIMLIKRSYKKIEIQTNDKTVV